MEQMRESDDRRYESKTVRPETVQK